MTPLSPAGYEAARVELVRFRERFWQGYQGTRRGRRGRYFRLQARKIARMGWLTERVSETEHAWRAEKQAA